MRQKLIDLFAVIEKDLAKSSRIYELSKKSALEIARSASLSPSQAGDRYHSAGAMEIAKDKYEKTKAVYEEIQESLKNSSPEFVEAPCFVKMDKIEFYLLNNVVSIPEFKIVSAKSPLGEAVLGQKVGSVINGMKILEIG